MTKKENRETLENYINCLLDKDVEGLRNLLHDDFIEEYPQSGERIRGIDNWNKVYEEFRDLPTVKAYNLHVSDDLAVIEMLLEYSQAGTYLASEIVEFQDGKIKHMRAYFTQPFEAPDWRSEWVEKIGEPASPQSFDEIPRRH